MSGDEKLTNEEQAFADRLAGVLERPLDDATLARLQAAREEAVHAAMRSRLPRTAWYVGGSAGGAIAAGVALFFMLQTPSLQPLPDLDETELAAAADIELLESLELLAWLDDEMLAIEAADEG
ncbi:MAG: hypothetical protein AAFQ16_03285 [Pseudomonadota bacterium]